MGHICERPVQENRLRERKEESLNPVSLHLYRSG